MGTATDSPYGPVSRETVEEVARVAGEAAADVDSHARYPTEAMSAAADVGLLSMWLPADLGGAGATLEQTAAVVERIGRECASTAMILAMHQIQLGCLRSHGKTPFLRELTARVGRENLLLASATTEIGIGGDVRRSTCHVQDTGDGTFELVKKAPVISYAQASDMILVTARRGPDSPATDQVLVVCEKADLTLEQTNPWNTVGFRGTCSPGFLLTARSSMQHVFEEDYADISARTMLPLAHTLWGHCWLGLAEGAVAVARRFVREQARRAPGSTPPGALRLAQIDVDLATMRARVHGAARRIDAEEACGIVDTSMERAIEDNTLKVYCSELVADLVTRALRVVGIAGYALGTPWSLDRPLRDAQGAALMVSNDRILANTATMELVYRGGPR